MIVDCDVHPTVPGMQALLPYLDDHWREAVVRRGIGRPVDWNYCADHAASDYKVWVEDGVVVHWERRGVSES